MKRVTRWLLSAAGAFILLFGMLCLNYTKADGLEHHKAVALRHGLPPPSGAILWGGAVAIVVGSGTIGYMTGVGKQSNGRLS